VFVCFRNFAYLISNCFSFNTFQEVINGVGCLAR